MALLDDLEAEVRANTNVDASASTLLARLATLLQEAKDSGDPVRLQAVIDSMKRDNASLAAAVAANTPGA
jgi:hypothetical protein